MLTEFGKIFVFLLIAIIFVVVLIFLIFDVEVVLLIPWALVYKAFGFGGFMVGAVFLILLGLGMAYEWRKGDLEWERVKIIPPVIKKPVFSNENTREKEAVKSNILEIGSAAC